jgi:hypothetical protein
LLARLIGAVFAGYDTEDDEDGLINASKQNLVAKLLGEGSARYTVHIPLPSLSLSLRGVCVCVCV